MRIPLGEGLGDAVAQPTNLRSAANNPDAFGAGLARVATGIGADMVQKQQQDDDSQAIFEARRKLDDWERTAIWDPQKGAVAKKGRDAFDLPQTLPGEYDQVASEIATSADPRVKRAVQGLVLARREQVTAFADGHALKQREWFNEQSYQADRQNFLDNAALYASDPVRVQTEIALQNDRTIGYLRNKGAPDELIQASVKDNTSRMHSAVLGSLLNQGEPLKAQKYLQDNAGGMNADDLLKAQHIIRGEVDMRIGAQVATEVVKSAVAKTAPTGLGRFSEAIKFAESRGRRYGDDGELLRGPVTASGESAEGEMQVMPSTYKNPGYGIRPADLSGTKEERAAEIARVGEQKLEFLVKRYGGDLRKAAAAYNAGEGNVDKAIADQAKNRAGVNGPDWLPYLANYQSADNHKQTVGYVSSVTKAYEKGGGAQVAPTALEVHEALRSDPRLANNPRALKIAMEQSTAQLSDVQKALKDREDAAVADVQRELISNGGRYADVPVAKRNLLPPKEVDNMLTFAKKISLGDDTTNPALYQRLTDPNVLTSMSENELFRLGSQLSEADRKHFAQQRQSLINAKNGGPPKPGDLDAAAVNTVLHDRLETAGIKTKGFKEGDNDSMRYGAIQKTVRESILRAQAVAGKNFNDVEIMQHVDRMFANTSNFRDSGWFTPDVKTGSTMRATYDDIPTDMRKLIEKDFAEKRGISNPSKGDVLAKYLQFMTRKAGL